MSEEQPRVLVITKVEKQQRGKHRYNIFLNEEYAFSVHEDILVKHRLNKGETLFQEQLQAIMQDEERNLGYVKALHMVGRRPHSLAEVKRKLKVKGFEPDIVSWVADKLIEQNYINDEQYAKMLTDHRVVSQKKGRNLIRQELQQKGIHKDVVKETIGSINPEDEYAAAFKIAQTKWKQTSGKTLDRKRKTAAFLMRRGYMGTLVQKVLNELSQGTEDDEIDFADEHDSGDFY
ncbi:RecX family transcriptional regulator [Paenibacillus oryzisoli]|uniref:regulatory protein RecX n=1 Tax=Paenibacillus oryzisoli TaxID=1850517 RepID=UPI003D2E34FB